MSVIDYTILMPCLNEENTIGISIRMAQNYILRSGISAEILIVDNGSDDNSANVARKLGARVVYEEKNGYGNALRTGIREANGRYTIMGDCDGTYDFSELDLFVKELKSGYDLVIGNRYRGGIQKDAMPLLHKYLGVPVLSWAARKTFHVTVGDFHCGLRGFVTKKAQKLRFKSEGMEFATEMIAQFAAEGLKIIEVPTKLLRCPVTRTSHLKTWHDGWRHLQYILKYRNYEKFKDVYKKRKIQKKKHQIK